MVEPGDRIEVVALMRGDPCPIPVGTTGTVRAVQTGFYNHTQVFVKWDIPRSLSLILPEAIASSAKRPMAAWSTTRHRST